MIPLIPANLSKLRIVLYPDPVLRSRCAPLREFGEDLKSLTDRMLDLMHEAKGVGLAGPQVGVLLRLFVCNPTGEPGDDQVCVNPRFGDLTGAAEAEEGCLSIPAVTVTMRRATHAVMETSDPYGNVSELSGEALKARVWQHEVDHLDGRLIIDNMSPTDEISNRRALKQLKEDYQASR